MKWNVEYRMNVMRERERESVSMVKSKEKSKTDWVDKNKNNTEKRLQ